MRPSLIINGIDFNARLDREKRMLNMRIDLWIDSEVPHSMQEYLEFIEYMKERISNLAGIPHQST